MYIDRNKVHSMTSYKLRGFLQFLGHRLQSGNNLAPTNLHGGVLMLRQNHYSIHQPLKLYTSSGNQSWRSEAKFDRLKNQKAIDVRLTIPNKEEATQNKVVQNKFGWVKSFMGFIIALLLPSWNEKWQQLKKIEGEAEMAIQGVEKMAEGLEKVAVVAEELAAEAAEKLSDQSKLKKAAMVIEHISKQAASDAQITIDFIHKVDALKQDLDNLETTIEKKAHDDSNQK